MLSSDHDMDIVLSYLHKKCPNLGQEDQLIYQQSMLAGLTGLQETKQQKREQKGEEGCMECCLGGMGGGIMGRYNQCILLLPLNL